MEGKRRVNISINAKLKLIPECKHINSFSMLALASSALSNVSGFHERAGPSSIYFMDPTETLNRSVTFTTWRTL